MTRIMKGYRFGSWRVLCGPTGSRGHWLCRCDCGTIRRIIGWDLKAGKTKSCLKCFREYQRSAHYRDKNPWFGPHLRYNFTTNENALGSFLIDDDMPDKAFDVAPAEDTPSLLNDNDDWRAREYQDYCG